MVFQIKRGRGSFGGSRRLMCIPDSFSSWPDVEVGERVGQGDFCSCRNPSNGCVHPPEKTAAKSKDGVSGMVKGFFFFFN